MEPKPRNDRQNAVTKFCLALEEFRRTDAGRVKNAKDLVTHFFAHNASNAIDQIFVHLPREVRAPVVAGWGIRGAKAAMRDDDERIRNVVEEGLTASILVDWIPLGEWWAFWRSGKVSGVPCQKALATARELGLFDDRWFLENLEGRGGKLKGTDTLCDTLSKDQIIAWIRSVHASGDGSPAGLVTALGWETILSKTAPDVLLFALDALATKLRLAMREEPPPQEVREVRGSEVPGIAIPDFPMEEKGTGTDSESIPEPSSSWPELAAPGDMGYALVQPSAMTVPAVKPNYGMDDDDEEITSEHQLVAKPVAPRSGS